ncbi:MAG: hypothetical protein JKY15_00725 [Deltaproteobacteria bacterium]|nr:hypothetical protein [Deltaproteobacteria bacterium]
MRVFLLFFCVASISLATTTSQEDSKYSRSGRFGLRFTSGGSAYGGGIDNKDNQTKADKARVDLNPSKNDKVGPPDYTKYISAGWLVPLQLEMTYGLTNAFELLLGLIPIFQVRFRTMINILWKSLG